MSTTVTPEVLWAQRSHKTDAAKNIIYLTISVPDVAPSSLKVELTSKSLSFFGHSESFKRDFQVDLEFYAEIDNLESKTYHSPMKINLVLRKKELREEYWPRLVKDQRKYHFIKTDFSRWVDEDEQDGAPDENLTNMSGMGGMPGMGDMSSMMGGAGGDFGGLDFSKLGGEMGEDETGGDDDDDDDEMPSLEGEDEQEESGESKTPPAESSDKAKIQEIS